MKKVLLVSVGFVFALVLNANTSADYQLGKNEAINLFNAATTTMECWSMPGWTGDEQKSFATWQNGELVLTVPGQCSERWQCQVKLKTNGIVLNNGKTYTFSCNMNASHDISLVTVKLFDDSPLSDVSNHTLKAGNNTVTNPAFQGGAVGNGIIVFDFGYAAGGDVIRVNNITLQEVSGAAQPDQPVVDGYTLVWNADFTQSSLNSAAWNIEVNGDGGGNNELQYYCEKGVSMGVEPTTGKHCLILTATKEDYMGKGCTSGRVNTKHKVNFTYGKVEARIWFPNTANGLWPAFWMLGENIDEVGWPQCGETDIIELGHQDGFKNGVQDRYFNGAMHVGEAWNSVWQDVNSVTYDYSVEDGFHTFTCEWTPNSVKMYVDKDTHPGVQPYFQTQLEGNDNPYYNRQLVWSKPSFVIFNLAVGGAFPGIYNVNQITALANGSRKMYVDWLRIYQKGEAGESFYSNVASDPIESGVQDGLIPAISSESASKKVLRNGQIVIERNGETFTILGNRLQ